MVSQCSLSLLLDTVEYICNTSKMKWKNCRPFRWELNEKLLFFLFVVHSQNPLNVCLRLLRAITENVLIFTKKKKIGKSKFGRRREGKGLKLNQITLPICRCRVRLYRDKRKFFVLVVFFVMWNRKHKIESLCLDTFLFCGMPDQWTELNSNAKQKIFM